MAMLVKLPLSQLPTLFLVMLCACTVQAEEAVSISETAGVFSTWQDRVIQIQVIDKQAGTKAGIGSGFFAGRSRWVVTNYHVVAELVNEPGKYTARYVADFGLEGSLELLAVDAVHDLALLQTEDLERVSLEIETATQPQGDCLYAMGYPFDIGLTIVEGTYNGLLEKSLYEKLHYTGSINPGMSGGPAINSAVRVVGVNVSTAGNQVSFLVPAIYVGELLANSSGEVATEPALRLAVGSQLLENQQRLGSRLLAERLPTTQLNNYSVPAALAAFINCWGNSDDKGKEDIALVYYRCQTGDDIFLSGSLSTGIIRYQHDLISSRELNPFRFYHQLEQRGQFPQLRLDGDENSVSNYACESDFVDQTGLPLKVTFCLRKYLEFDGLYDVYLTAISVHASREALQSTLVLAGFSWTNLSALSARFLEALKWQK